MSGQLLADVPMIGAVNYIQNSGFDEAGKSPLFGWDQISPGTIATTAVEGADTYMLAATTDSVTACGVRQAVPLRPEWTRILLRGEIRTVYQDTVPPPTGPSSDQFIGVALTWVDQSGKRTVVQDAQSWLYTTPGWVEINQMVDVPVGTVSVLVTPEVYHSKGSACFKDLNVSAWIPTLQDGFAGTQLDPTRWGITLGKHNVGSDEQQWFSADEITVANNMLCIHAEQKTANGFPYQSGQISSIGKFQQLYGIFEFQLKLPVVNGAWAAAYLLAWDDDWPPEIDVEELSGSQADTVIETNHYTDEYGRHRQSQVNFGSNGLDRSQWHTYSVVWEPGELAWYIDGIYRGTTGQPYDDTSSVPMYITINLAIGSFGGDPSQATWPQDYYCRQVSVFQRSDLPLPLYPEASQEITLPINTVTLGAVTCSPHENYQTTWKLVDGPGLVKIADPHKVTTTATFSKPGMYHFSINIAKGAAMNTGQVYVYVNGALGKH